MSKKAELAKVVMFWDAKRTKRTFPGSEVLRVADKSTSHERDWRSVSSSGIRVRKTKKKKRVLGCSMCVQFEVQQNSTKFADKMSKRLATASRFLLLIAFDCNTRRLT